MRRRTDTDIEIARAPEWITRPERSNTVALRLIVWIALKLGRPTARLLLYPICLYFMILSRQTRAASKKYLRKVLEREPGFAEGFRHYHCFAAAILDRVFLFNGQYARFDVSIYGEEIVADLVTRGEGCILLGAHLGSFEIIRALSRKCPGVRVSLVMYEENARQFNSVLRAVNPHLFLRVIALGQVDSMLKVEAALQCGDFVGMLGDRTIQDEGTVACEFLGEQARFPIGPFRIAAMLKRPIVLMFGLYRGGNRYDIYFEKFADDVILNRERRAEEVQLWVQRYVKRLENFALLAPFNWFNFYPFWD
jgi:predicted LPLAT superfamily acyltransferase